MEEKYLATDVILKDKIKEQLDGSFAHTPYPEILKKISLNNINTKPPKVDYTLWQLLEHIRIAHWDIIEFMENSNYIYLKFPNDYWPDKSLNATKEMWNKTIQEIHDLYKKTVEMLFSPGMDLFATIPHGNGQHYLREFLLIAEHNAYHFGQLMSYIKII